MRDNGFINFGEMMDNGFLGIEAYPFLWASPVIGDIFFLGIFLSLFKPPFFRNKSGGKPIGL